MKVLFAISRVMEVLDISRPAVYKLIYEGKLDVVKVSKRNIKVSESSLDKFIKENTIMPDDFVLGIDN